MKYNINKAAFDALTPELQALYKVSGDGTYNLSVDGLPDVAGLKDKNAELLREKAATKAKKDAEIATAVEAAVEAALAKAHKEGDTVALEASWQKKYDTQTATLQGKIDGLNGNVSELTSGAAASKLVSEIGISGFAAALMPHVASRLKTEMVDGKPKVTVLGTDGKASAATIAEFTEELRGNAALSPLIIGSKGKGKGTTQHNGNPGTGNVDLSSLSGAAKLQYARENPQT